MLTVRVASLQPEFVLTGEIAFPYGVPAAIAL
jgi:hypothetical protein